MPKIIGSKQLLTLTFTMTIPLLLASEKPVFSEVSVGSQQPILMAKAENNTQNSRSSNGSLLSKFQQLFKSKIIPSLASEFGPFKTVANYFLQQFFDLGYQRMSQEINQVLGEAGLPDLSQLDRAFNQMSTIELAPLSAMIYDSSNSVNSQVISKSTSNLVVTNLGRAIADGTTLGETAQQSNNQILSTTAETALDALKIADKSQQEHISQAILKDISALLAQHQTLEAIQIKQNLDLQYNQAVTTRAIASLLEEIQSSRLKDIKDKNAAQQLLKKQSQITLPLLLPPSPSAEGNNPHLSELLNDNN